MAKALDGITVLELCGERGQLMGKLMGDMGARVIKVEPIGGSETRNIGPFKDDEINKNQSLYFWSNNMNLCNLAFPNVSIDKTIIFRNILSSR